MILFMNVRRDWLITSIPTYLAFKENKKLLQMSLKKKKVKFTSQHIRALSKKKKDNIM